MNHPLPHFQMTQYTNTPVVSDDRVSIILPTHEIYTQFMEDLVSMSTHDYDMTELMSLCVTALTNQKTAVDDIARIGSQWQKLSTVASHPTFDNDMQILATAWITFTTKLLKLYIHFNLWDERGQANFYFHQLINGDLAISLFPRIYPR